jgi:hypothetical protein
LFLVCIVQQQCVAQSTLPFLCSLMFSPFIMLYLVGM